ncbi:MAG: DNA-3-methyladenine glycosylase [Saprospiraceae bacterium]
MMQTKGKRLTKPFYTRTDVVQISKELLGKYLVTNIDGLITSGKITETEAYRAPDDKACHAHNNRRTARTEVMFAEGGRLMFTSAMASIIYLVVTATEDMAHVLVRAVEPVDNIESMLLRRKMKKLERRLFCRACGDTQPCAGHHDSVDRR